MEPPDPPSPFLLEWLPRVTACAARGPVLDLACGRGRHALAVAAAGAPAVALDRDPERLAALAHAARRRGLPVVPLRADPERDSSLPLRPGRCGAVLVFRYLHRPLARALAEALAPGGLLLYETFTIHQRDLGHGPENPAFLLGEGELPELFDGLEVLHHDEGVTAGPRPQALARLAARSAAA